MHSRVHIAQSGTTLRAPKSTLCLNFYAPSRPKDGKLAGLVNIELARLLEGADEKQYAFERELDKSSWVRFAVKCNKVRTLQPDEVSQSYELMKLIQEGSPDKYSIHSSDSKQGVVPLAKSIEKMLDQFFTPKTVKEKEKKSPPSNKQRSEVISQQSNRDRESGYSTPVPKVHLPTPELVTRPPPTTPSLPKQDIAQILAKFESQHRLRQSLQVELEKARRENEALRQRTDYINQRLQESDRKIREVAEASKKQTLSQKNIVQQENRQLKEDLREVRYAYEQESSISATLQRELMHLNQMLQTQKKINTSLQSQIDELKVERSKYSSSPKTPKQKEQLSEQEAKLKGRLQKVENQLREKSVYCIELEGELEYVNNQLLELKDELFKRSQILQPEALEHDSNELIRRIQQLEDEIAEKDYIIQDLDTIGASYGIIDQFNRKQEDIKATFAIIQMQCQKLIEVVRQKQRQSLQRNKNASQNSRGVQTQHGEPYHTLSPETHQHYHSVMDLRKSMIVVDESEIIQMRSENQSLKEQAKELQESLRDSRRTLWDFKQMIFKVGNHSQMTEVHKTQRSSSRHRHHMRHIDRLKVQYTDKLRQMYNQIVHLNEIIYASSSKQKQMQVEVETINQKYSFMENATRDMRRHLEQCQATHIPTINTQISTIESQTQQISQLKDTICQQQEQISNFMKSRPGRESSSILQYSQDSQLSLLTVENKELERRYGEMMLYIEELRAENQKAEELLIIKEAELEELRELKGKSRRKSRNNSYVEAGSAGQSPIDEQPISVQDSEEFVLICLQQITELLERAFKGNQQLQDINAVVKSLLQGVHEAHIPKINAAQGRSERVKIMEKIREASVEFLRIKLDRLKSLEGSSELRKEFLKSVRPLQAKFDELLCFRQGVLNTKVSSQQII